MYWNLRVEEQLRNKQAKIFKRIYKKKTRLNLSIELLSLHTTSMEA